MEVVVLRRYLKSNIGTIGNIIYKEEPIAVTLEHPFLDNRALVSCIPVGSYLTKEDNSGRFKWWALNGVPNRSNIEIHQGNTLHDTLGCIIVGKVGSERISNKNFLIGQSLDTLKKMKEILPKEFNLIVE